MHIYSDFKENLTATYVFKPITMLLLIMYAYLHITEDNEHFSYFILYGLIFCLIGDILLMLKKKDLFIHGLLAFLFGHIFYLLSIIHDVGFNFSLGVAIPLLFIFMIIQRILQSVPAKFKIYINVYSLVIVVLLWQAIERAIVLTDLSSIIFSIGVLFFVVSDFLLAYSRFISKISLAQIFILGTYYTAQVMIVISG